MKIAKEVKIALVAIAGVMVLFFGMNFLKGLSMFSTDSTYYISFKDISGLTTSCPIYAGGYKVGVVKSIDYDFENDNEIIVETAINPDLRIPVGSRAAIKSDMMGNVQMDLLLGDPTGEIVPTGGMIVGGIDGGALGMVSGMLPAMESMLPKLDSILASLNALLADPALTNSLHNVETISNNLTTTTEELNTLMASLNRAMPSLMRNANTMLANADTLTRTLNDIDITGTLARVDATLANVEQFTKKLNSKEGTLGLMLNDPSLYNNLNATMQSADALLVNFKEHPKRYVHFSLFGKKDK